MSPLCFVLMPFGSKHDPAGGPDIDFNRVYETAIEPGITDAGLEPVRADNEVTGGIIHKPMFERLLLCDFAVADLTTANANVFYELGVRHAARPSTTLPIFAAGQRIPFDVQLVRALQYKLGADNQFRQDEANELRTRLAARLRELRAVADESAAPDSPLLQLLQGYSVPDLAHLRTDLVEKQLVESAANRRRIAEARATKPLDLAAKALATLEASLGELRDVETGVVVDLYLSYRAVGAYDEMLSLYDRMPKTLRSAVLVREQRAFALNRKAAKTAPPGRELLRAEAERILTELVDQHGANAETCGLLGRIHKDRWDETRAQSPDEAAAWLERAIAEYTRGFSADWRDCYPGINAATLLELEGSEKSLADKARILPVVRFAAEQRVTGRPGDYWDHATLLEAAVLANDWLAASKHIGRALAAVRQYWEPETTSRNLGMLEQVRRDRGQDVARLAALRAQLDAKTAQLRGA
jgi:hypothetical protein